MNNFGASYDDPEFKIVKKGVFSRVVYIYFNKLTNKYKYVIIENNDNVFIQMCIGNQVILASIEDLNESNHGNLLEKLYILKHYLETEYPTEYISIQKFLRENVLNRPENIKNRNQRTKGNSNEVRDFISTKAWELRRETNKKNMTKSTDFMKNYDMSYYIRHDKKNNIYLFFNSIYHCIFFRNDTCDYIIYYCPVGGLPVIVDNLLELYHTIDFRYIAIYSLFHSITDLLEKNEENEEFLNFLRNTLMSQVTEILDEEKRIRESVKKILKTYDLKFIHSMNYDDNIQKILDDHFSELNNKSNYIDLIIHEVKLMKDKIKKSIQYYEHHHNTLNLNSNSLNDDRLKDNIANFYPDKDNNNINFLKFGLNLVKNEKRRQIAQQKKGNSFKVRDFILQSLKNPLKKDDQYYILRDEKNNIYLFCNDKKIRYCIFFKLNDSTYDYIIYWYQNDEFSTVGYIYIIDNFLNLLKSNNSIRYLLDIIDDLLKKNEENKEFLNFLRDTLRSQVSEILDD